MTPGPDDSPGALERENAALNEQIKLLVQTEQRLYRSQNQLDAQLERIRALAGFALQTSDGEPVPSILARALEILWRKFSLDWCGVISVTPGGEVVVVSVPEDHPVAPGPVVADRDTLEWLRARTDSFFAAGLSADGDQALAGLARMLSPDAATRHSAAAATQVCCVPLRRVNRERGGWLVTMSFRRRLASMADGALGEEHLPFVQLLASHADHAIANALLTDDLRERSSELARSLEELERAQQDLVQAQKMEAVGRLAGGVAHDFNNLLTVIMGYAGAVANALPEGSPQHGNVQRVVEAARRAAGITGQLLALGRRQVLRREAFDISEQTANTTSLLRRLVGEHIQVELVLDRDLPWVSADRAQFEQVLLNLVVNAREAMPGGGAMRIETRAANATDAARADADFEPSQFVALSVSDSGVGMDSGTMARIFEPFYTTKEPGKGTGLGLAVVYGAVKQGEGHVQVESVPGRGSRFTVLLPVAHQEHRERAAGVVLAETANEPASADARCVLVVEDEAAIRHVVGTVLRSAGYRVADAAHGVEALERLASGPRVDLVLTDVMMPRMGGVELAAEIARLGLAVRIAFMSGYSEDLLISGSLQDRQMPFLGKPFTPDVLTAFVAQQFERGANG